MKRWFEMKKLPDDDGDEDEDRAEIMIYGEIGKNPWEEEDSMSASDFDRELKGLGDVKAIDLRINSPGGNVMEATAIHNMIKSHPATVTASIDGIAASAASYVAMAADKVRMPENTFMLIHKPAALTIGTDEDHDATSADLKRMNSTFAACYSAKCGESPDKVMALMSENRLMTAAECKQRGYADEMVPPVKMAANFPLRLLPKEAREIVAKAVTQFRMEFKCGAARDLAIGPEKAWDGAAAKKAIFDHAGFDGDNPDPEKAKPYFLAHDDEAPKEKGSYKFPFAEQDGGAFKAAPSGIRAAASRLPGSDLPDNVKTEARAVLDHYEEKMKKDDGEKAEAKRVSDILALCATQGTLSADAQRFIAQKLPLDKVRIEIAALKAKAADARRIDPTVPEKAKPDPSIPFAHDPEILARKRALADAYIYGGR